MREWEGENEESVHDGRKREGERETESVKNYVSMWDRVRKPKEEVKKKKK